MRKVLQRAATSSLWGFRVFAVYNLSLAKNPARMVDKEKKIAGAERSRCQFSVSLVML